ncbi:MAG: ferredoxin, partial [Aquificota bacterium]
PANHYLPRTETKVHVDEHLLHAENPLFLEVLRRHHVGG